MHGRPFLPTVVAVLLVPGGFFATGAVYAQFTPAVQQITTRLTANSLKADVSFLASDALQGRGTPSRGLDIAAEYIAAQFRRAGLKPVGDDGYFQTAHFVVCEQSSEGAELTVHGEGVELRLGKDELRIESPGLADFKDVTAVKVDLKTA